MCMREYEKLHGPPWWKRLSSYQPKASDSMYQLERVALDVTLMDQDVKMMVHNKIQTHPIIVLSCAYKIRGNGKRMCAEKKALLRLKNTYACCTHS